MTGDQETCLRQTGHIATFSFISNPIQKKTTVNISKTPKVIHPAVETRLSTTGKKLVAQNGQR